MHSIKNLFLEHVNSYKLFTYNHLWNKKKDNKKASSNILVQTSKVNK